MPSAHLPRVLRTDLALAGNIVLIGNRLARDEAAFKIAVDRAASLRRLGPSYHRPGVRFLRADGEESQQPEQIVAGADDTIEAAVVQAKSFQELGAIGLRQLRNLGLDRRRDDDLSRIFGSRAFHDPRREYVQRHHCGRATRDACL